MENRFEKFTYLIFKIAKLIQRIKNLEMANLGLKAVHVMCIYHLSKNENGLTSKELVDLTLEDKAAISRALSLLKEKDLISYDGGYNATINLTSNGKKVASYINIKSDEALTNCSQDINEEERIKLYQALKKVEVNMEDYYQNLLYTSKDTNK